MQDTTMKLTLCEVPGSGDLRIETYSPFCVKVRRALRAAGLAFEARQSSNPRAFKQYNPLGQVPILLVEATERPVFDSTKILEFIATELNHGGSTLVPKGAREQAEAWLWEDYADRALNGFLVAARWDSDDNWERTRTAYFKGAPWFVQSLIAPQIRKNVRKALAARDVTSHGSAHVWSEFERVLDHLEVRAPREGFWVSDQVTVADVSIFGQLQSLRNDLTPAQRSTLEARSILRAYLDRVDAATRA
jgi:glutathione S-transferase